MCKIFVSIGWSLSTPCRDLLFIHIEHMYSFQLSSKAGNLLEEYWLFKHPIRRELLLCPICCSGDVYMTRCQEYAQKCDTLHEISELILYGDCATHLATSVATFLALSEYQMSVYY